MMSPQEKQKVIEDCRRLEEELLREQKRLKIMQKARKVINEL